MSDETDQSAAPIIEAFGGIRPMAAKLDAPVSTVQGWKQRDTIPASRMAEIRQVAQDNQIALPMPGDVADDVVTSDDGGDAKPGPVTKPGEPKTVPVSAPKPDAKPDSGTPASATGGSGGGKATGIAVLALLVALGGGGWLWWTTEGPGANVGENTRISELEGRVARLAETSGDVGKADRDALAQQIESLRNEVSKISAPDVSGELSPLRAALAKLTDQVSQLETAGVGASDPEIAKRLNDLEAGIQSASEMATKDREALSGGIGAFETKLGDFETRVSALDEKFGGFARDGAEHEAAALEAITVSLIATRLRGAAQSGAPYRDVLTTLESVAGDDPVLASLAVRLAPDADKGVATRDELVFAFPDTAVAIIDNAPADAESDIVDQILDRARRVVRVRRVGTDLPEDSVDGRIARAELRLNAGDVAGAVTVLEEFEGRAATAAAPWLQRAQAHVELSAALGSLDDHVLTRLRGAGGVQ